MLLHFKLVADAVGSYYAMFSCLPYFLKQESCVSLY
jgi:hypothetical protein